MGRVHSVGATNDLGAKVKETVEKRYRQAPLQPGTILSKALAAVGITEERVSKFIGEPCGCRRRREKLNRLADWAWTVLRGRPAPEAVEELDKMVGDGTPPSQPTE